jgi:dTDP-4-dehydrorhamnose reductase
VSEVLLVTGVTGLLGANFALEALRGGHCIAGVAYPCQLAQSPVPVHELDLRDEAGVEALLRDVRPAAVFHFAALTNVDWCETHVAETHELNAAVSGRLAAAAARLGARFLYMSTDSVFDGECGGYVETDEPKPVNVYAASKRAGELAVLQAHPAALVVRSNIFGWNAQPKTNLAEWILNNLRVGRALPGFTDTFFAPLLVNTLARWMLALSQARLKGVLHVASRAAISKYEFARALARTFDLPESLIQPQLSAAASGARRPLNTALNGAVAARQLGWAQPGLGEMLQEFQALEVSGWVARLRHDFGG